MTKIAIIGAGLAGITLARSLPEHAQITIFEKARGIGGRMATRYAGAFEFDHGAQYFTSRSTEFSNLITDRLTTGQVRKWPDQIAKLGGAHESDVEKYVASPRMNTLCKDLAEGIDVRTGIYIHHIEKQGDVWQLQDKGEGRHGPFEWVVSAAPAPQSSKLLPAAFNGHGVLERVRMIGCFTLMLGYDSEITLPWPAARIAGSPIGWITLNSDKPGRDTGTSLLIQSSNDWAEAHLEEDYDKVQEILLKAATDLAQTDLGGAVHEALHRWRYAATPEPAGRAFLLDEGHHLAACGDWCLGSRVEAAFSSGYKLGEALSRLI